MTKNFTWLFASLILFLSPLANASVEIYSILTNRCELSQGLIIDINEDTLSTLDLDGQLKTINRKNIEFLIVHNTLENPFNKIKLNAFTKSKLLSIYVGGSVKPMFIGWAVKFIEDLVIFFDIKGSTHVVELSRITKIRPLSANINNQLKLRFFECSVQT